MSKKKQSSIDVWQGQRVEPGQSVDLKLKVGERRTGAPVRIPMHVRRGLDDGPTVFVTGALHGDEINGTGAIQQLLVDPEFQITRGTLVLIPVLNMLGFERHERYLPDRRDLNRSFPGTPSGSLASRLAYRIFNELVFRCDFGIDLHTASVRRTNYPNVRGDLSDAAVKRIAMAFGCEVIINGVGPAGALRSEATAHGCPTIVMEGGEVSKVEPGIVQSAVRGVCNVLRELQMLSGVIESPRYQVVIEQSKWLRANKGGFMQFHIVPGELLERDQPVATIFDLLGHVQTTISCPFDAVVIGMNTLPAVSPGEPICHLGQLPSQTSVATLRKSRRQEDGLEEKLVDQLSSNVVSVTPDDVDSP
ncbi:succinylglutamate desuccinylase/aspartoacylase family protein [Roseiconus lacunae]|uniref:Succinylglutamate desuccinylase/aspartoacylase family protein n=1 Tax=Roseiconus lacunae TaxID=2605694 RepID=A0ABT7PC84_9BACT|nr:succinylglutamate desuccinylase/aspartoacylase family protein [Roseiconus lacunae]MCD0463489.1 succinylglutamate desuccinylase/aspartoacylase family protein [Roseiconus lacunae]MDM4014061.1 succinylglutamate desuccinylase/aspartoacylase family protein [Roseiconus lacunae]WRQ53353.1 succinylglutamate desuccinylase/aspartoacylase family protein [Stieleria sp. HD01]